MQGASRWSSAISNSGRRSKRYGFSTGRRTEGSIHLQHQDSAPDELLRAIRTVLSGRTYVSPAISDAAVGRRGSPAGDSVFALLTGREREVLQLLAEGCSTQEIADRVSLSPKTVYYHREQVMEKLGIDSVARLTRYAIQEGLTPAELVGPSGR